MAYRHKCSAIIWCTSRTQPQDAARQALEWARDTARLLASEYGHSVELACDADELAKQAEACAKQAGGVLVVAAWEEDGEALDVRAEPAGQ